MLRVVDRTKRYGLFVLVSLLTFAGCAAEAVSFKSLSAAQAKALIAEHANNADFVLLDVRTLREYNKGHIKGAILLDYYSPEFEKRLHQLDRLKTYLLYCRSGNRSGKTLKLLKQMKFEKVHHLSGGLLDWQKNKYPLEAGRDIQS